MSDNDIRAAATDLLSRVEYGRISDLTRAEMTPWDELGDDTRENWRVSFRRHVDVLVDAGWRPPARVITTDEELYALPVDTLLLDRWRTVWHRRFVGRWIAVLNCRPDAPDRIVLDGTVLWTPEEGNNDA